MRRPDLLRILPVALTLVVLATTSSADEAQEPPLEFAIKIGDQTVTLKEGESAQLEGTFTDPKVTVTPLPTRVFSFRGVTFRYPRSFTFESDLEAPSSQNWTLSGNDLTIMFFDLKARLTPEEFGDSMMDEFGRINCKVLDPNASIQVRDHTLRGMTLEVSVADHKMAMDIYAISVEDGASRLLVFQDSLDERGKRSQEGKAAIKHIQESFQLQNEK